MLRLALWLTLVQADPPEIREAGPIELNTLGARRAGPSGELPPAVDNSRLPGFPPIRAQNLPHDCPAPPCRHPGVVDGTFKSQACQSFSIVYYQFTHNLRLESELAGRPCRPEDLPAFSPRWTHSFAFAGQGAHFTDLYPILARHGAAAWEEFPFADSLEPWCTDPAVWEKALTRRIDHAEFVRAVDTPEGLRKIRRLLVNGYVLVIYTYSRSRVWATFGDDPATRDDDVLAGKRVVARLDGRKGGHAMTLVGYDDQAWTDLNGNGRVDDGEKGAFRVADSNGPDREDAGFIWFAYDAIRSRSAFPEAVPGERVPAWSLFGNRAFHLVVGDKLDYRPALLARFTVRHAVRGELGVTLGVGEPGAERPSATWQPHVLRSRPKWVFNKRSFDGTEKESEATFVLDLTPLSGRDPARERRYFLQIEDACAGHPATLTDFRVVEPGGGREAVSKGGTRTVDGGVLSAWVDAAFPR